MTGADLIAEERVRQIKEEGFDNSHDNDWTDAEMVRAAVLYALPENYIDFELRTHKGVVNVNLVDVFWPSHWDQSWWKPSDGDGPDDRIRDLVKAGALIAAEIDRIQRMGE